MDYEKMTAPCGLPCFDCVIHLANEDEEKRARVAEFMGVPPEQVGCTGCRDVEGACPAVPSFCHIFPCSKDKGVTFCYECQDFPCDEFHPHADKAQSLPLNLRVFNLCLIKKMGVEEWAKTRAKSTKEEYFKGKCPL